MSEALMLVTPLNIQSSLDSIFGAVLLGGIDRSVESNTELLKEKISVVKVARNKLLNDFRYNVFSEEYAVFYEILVTKNIKTFDESQLRSVLEVNKDLIIDSPYIDRSAYNKANNGNTVNDDEFFEIKSEDVVNKFKRLSNTSVSLDDFESSCTIYKDWYKKAYYSKITNDVAIITQDMGLDVKLPGKRVRHYQGMDDAREYYNYNIDIIDSLNDENAVVSTVLNERWLQEEMANEYVPDSTIMFNTGIKEIDSIIGSFRRGHLIGIMGPPKGGKTRFTAYLVERALRLGFNVCVWPLEGTKEEWQAMIESCQIASTSYLAMKQGKCDEIIRIDSDDIRTKKYLNSKQIRSIVNAAKEKIAVGENYGKLSFMEGPAYIEDFTELLKNHYETKNPFDVVVIDPLINVSSKSGKRTRVDVVSDAYRVLKTFLQTGLKSPVLGLAPCQLKQTVVDDLRAHPELTIDVTAGGETAETSRAPDNVFGLFSSKEERNSNMMKIYHVASRHSQTFNDFTARCYLGSCFFLSEEDDILSK